VKFLMKEQWGMPVEDVAVVAPTPPATTLTRAISTPILRTFTVSPARS
jgi:hypothetical protein